jgi:hypothetical protein
MDHQISQKNRQRLSKYLTRLSSCRDSRTSVTIDEEEEEKENGHRKITKTVSDAPIISKKSVILERKLAVSARKRRTNKTLGSKLCRAYRSKSMSVFSTSITTLSKDIRRPGKLIMEME